MSTASLPDLPAPLSKRSYAFNLQPLSLPARPLSEHSYAFTGIIGCVATIAGAWALHKGRSLAPCLSLFVASICSVLACLGLSCFMLDRSVEMGMKWWMYLICAWGGHTCGGWTGKG